MHTLDELIEILLELAQKSCNYEEVPVASIIFSQVSEKPKQYTIESYAINNIRKKKDPTAHSEMEALRSACHKAKNERIPHCSILTTLEPCLMCSSAISLARLQNVYYLSPRDKGPGLTWLLSQSEPKSPHRLNHYPNAISLPKQAPKYQSMLRSFFQERRK